MNTIFYRTIFSYLSMKPTLKKVSKYENKFAKLQKKAAEFNFRNQLKQVKKKEFTLEEEDKEVRIIVIDRIRLGDVTSFCKNVFSLFPSKRSARAFFGLTKRKKIWQKYNKSNFSTLIIFPTYHGYIWRTFLFQIYYIRASYISAIGVPIDRFIDNFLSILGRSFFTTRRVVSVVV